MASTIVAYGYGLTNRTSVIPSFGYGIGALIFPPLISEQGALFTVPQGLMDFTALSGVVEFNPQPGLPVTFEVPKMQKFFAVQRGVVAFTVPGGNIKFVVPPEGSDKTAR